MSVPGWQHVVYDVMHRRHEVTSPGTGHRKPHVGRSTLPHMPRLLADFHLYLAVKNHNRKLQSQ